uniref:Uncharacterized protein n=1 Tax=Arundo donax TaxID=35708 RepID=A0A0A8YX45_ARUDO
MLVLVSRWWWWWGA